MGGKKKPLSLPSQISSWSPKKYCYYQWTRRTPCDSAPNPLYFLAVYLNFPKILETVKNVKQFELNLLKVRGKKNI